MNLMVTYFFKVGFPDLKDRSDGTRNGCTICRIRAPFVMRIESPRRGPEPDLLFVSREREHLLTRTYLDGPADLAIEIISPDSIDRDRRDKFAEYEAAGVREYWLFDPDRETAEFYELDADGRYHLADAEDGIYYSKV